MRQHEAARKHNLGVIGDGQKPVVRCVWLQVPEHQHACCLHALLQTLAGPDIPQVPPGHTKK
jgi:hypothetical protein